MHYNSIYERLINRAKNRILSGYVERHHVLPKCLGGSDELANIVALTPEEHYLAHQLLVKIHPGNQDLLTAAVLMSGRGKGNKRFGWLRRKWSEQNRQRKGTAHPMFGRKHSEETKRKMREAKLGKKFSEETRRKISEVQRGKKLSPEHNAKLDQARRRPHSKEHNRKISEGVRRRLALTSQ